MPDGQSYYGHPAVKPPPFDRKVAYYIQIGGIGGAAQCIAAVASLGGGERMQSVSRNGRYLAALAGATGPLFLVADLKTPNRWYNMLRIYRRTSPMSIGSWILTGFGLCSAMTAAGHLARERGHDRIGRAGMLAQLPAALLGSGMATYTASLLSATSNPLWAAAPRPLAAQFGSSAVAGGAAAQSLLERLSGSDDNARRLDRLALAATAVECVASAAAKRRYRAEGVTGALEQGCTGTEDRLATLLGQVVPIACLGTNLLRRKPSVALSVIGALSVIAGGALRKTALVEAGPRAALDPDYYLRFTGAPSGEDAMDEAEGRRKL